MLNKLVSRLLRKGADLLEEQGANEFRVSAYRHAADTVESLHEDLSRQIRQGGYAALVAIPGIGPGIARVILEIERTGRWAMLDRLRGDHHGHAALLSVPGLGPELAARVHDQCGVETLEELEQAAYDGRLENVPGVGKRRLSALRGYLAGVLGRRGRRSQAPIEPPLSLLLEVDREYREKAEQGALVAIAPKRFNPRHERWLPVLHTVRDHWHFSVFFSNTERAHRLGKVRDWVVVYFWDLDHPQGQRTVVTETHGPLKGHRVIRGREVECFMYYDLPLAKAS